MDFIKKLVSDINAKDDENSVFEKEKCELENNVTNQEEHIKKKNKTTPDAFGRKERIWNQITKRHFCIKK